MSFALEVKEEVLSHEFNDIQSLSFLCGFIKYNGEFSWSLNQEKLKLSSSSNRISRSIFKLCKNNFKGSIDIGILENKKLKLSRIYYIILKGKVTEFLKKINAFDENQNKVIEFFPPIKNLNERDLINCKRAYIAGVFVAIGSVNSPDTTNYHLELQFKDLFSAKYWSDFLKEFELNFKVLNRKDKIYLAYIKKSQSVSDFLKVIDAIQSVMKFENLRISRNFSNNLNRMTNIDSSNAKKSLEVGLKQIEEISKLQKNRLNNNLSDKTKLLMALRLKNPYASYTELSDLMYDKGVEITKSGVSNLFKIIHKLSGEIE